MFLPSATVVGTSRFWGSAGQVVMHVICTQVVGSILETVTAEMKAGPGPKSGICSRDLLQAKGIASKPVIDSNNYVGGLQYK